MHLGHSLENTGHFQNTTSQKLSQGIIYRQGANNFGEVWALNLGVDFRLRITSLIHLQVVLYMKHQGV
jgi:hypothetical protein